MSHFGAVPYNTKTDTVLTEVISICFSFRIMYDNIILRLLLSSTPREIDGPTCS